MANEHGAMVKRFGAFETVSFFLFCASAPLVLPVFDIWRMLVPFEASQNSLVPSALFYDALPLSAMFTALVFLFVCLLKTAYARINVRVMMSALMCYVCGCALACLLSIGVVSGELAGTLCGLAIGYGGAVMVLFWVSNLHLPDFRGALFVAWSAACALFVNVAFMALADISVVRACLMVEALLASLGCGRLFMRFKDEEVSAGKGGSNWWDVFGSLDISMVDGVNDFEKPSARALFLAVVPAAILLLFIADIGLAQETERAIGFIVAGGVVAVVSMIPLLRMKSDQALVNLSYRFFLPLVAFATFALAVFVDTSYERLVMMVGVFAFCTVYTLVMLAMLFVMAGRMRSLGLPAASLMIIAACVVCMLSNGNAGADVLEPYRFRILVVLVLLTVVALSVTPSSHVWRVMLNGIDAVEMSAHDQQESYVHRCEELSREYGLTAREAEILLILGRGHTSGFIAKELTVAESTVRSHRKNIYRKLGVSSREELFTLLDAEDTRCNRP